MLEYDLFTALWRTGLIYLLAEVFEGYVLMPKILGDSLGLHPVVVLASLMIGGAALGMFGILLALPLAATVIILTRELVLPALRKTAMESG
jgi:predicted PurR-regulated permease PerM